MNFMEKLAKQKEEREMDAFWDKCIQDTNNQLKSSLKAHNPKPKIKKKKVDYEEKKMDGDNFEMKPKPIQLLNKSLKKYKDEQIQPLYSSLFIPTSNEVDLKYNPYPDPPKPKQNREKSSHVYFDEWIDGVNVHSYTLEDERGGYTEYISTASTLLTTWKKWNELPNDDEELHSLPKLVRAQNESKNDWNRSGSGYRYEKSIHGIRNAFVSYLNNFTMDMEKKQKDKQIILPSFYQRKQAFDSVQDGTPKNIEQFFPSLLFLEIEAWIVQDCPTFSPFIKTQYHDQVGFIRLIYDQQYHEFSHIQHLKLRQSFIEIFQTIQEFEPFTGFDIMNKYQINTIAGTALHNYLEYRLSDPINHTAELAKKIFELREPSDYDHAENFIKDQNPRHELKTEVRFGSFKHKICGSSDLVRKLPNGVYRIEDYKRTDVFNKKLWFKEQIISGITKPVLRTEPLSSPLIKYAIQLAIYRKLAILSGSETSPLLVDTIGCLYIFHPSLPNYVTIEVDLNQQMMTDTEYYFKGIGIKEYGLEALNLSPIELVELLFQFHQNELEHIFFGAERRFI